MKKRNYSKILSMVLIFLISVFLTMTSNALGGDIGFDSEVETNKQVPIFGSDFWKHWGDGQAEISTYDLSYPRYGEIRKGLAVTIFVTESMSESSRVKVDMNQVHNQDVFPVMKLNLVQDFPTGIYDYNTMSSIFLALLPYAQRPAGSLAKVSYSSQEWCGHVFQQLLFDAHSIRYSLHSYFDGEADRDGVIDYPSNTVSTNGTRKYGGFSEDGLLMWARGFASPVLSLGERKDFTLISSLEKSRLMHQPLSWRNVILSVDQKPKNIPTVLGEVEVLVKRADIDEDEQWIFYVERAFPNRLLHWESKQGFSAELIRIERLKYWEMNQNQFVESLQQLGLNPRPPRTP